MPLPGLSPICCTDRVQIEHWEKLFSELRLKKMMSTHKPGIFFINTDFCKNTPYKPKAQSAKA